MDEWDELESGYKPKGNYKIHDENKNALLNNYVVPPFSVLDTKAGYWQDRKNSYLIMLETVQREDMLKQLVVTLLK
nr:MAG TPA: Putative modification methylase [Caudoviricetes sp.]